MYYYMPPHQFKRLSDFAADLAQVSIASIAIPFIIDDFRPFGILLGIGFAAVFYLMSFIANKYSL